MCALEVHASITNASGEPNGSPDLLWFPAHELKIPTRQVLVFFRLTKHCLLLLRSA